MSHNSQCPICNKETVKATEHSFVIKDILDKWESITQFHFSSSVRSIYNTQQTTLLYCSNCSFSFYNPALVGNSDFYSDITDTENDYYNKDKWEFRKAIQDIKNANAQTVLDIGCGSGYFLESLREHSPNIEASGYEISHDLTQVARQKGFKIYTDVFPKQVLDNDKIAYFDVICIFQVLEHVENAMEILLNAKKLLKPNGKIIIAVPDIEGPVGKYYKFSHMNMPPHHISHWNNSVIRHAAKQLNMRVETVKYEPLADYLYPSYLRPIFEDALKWDFLRTISRKLRLSKIALKVLNLFKIKELHGVRGHSIYAVLTSETD